MKFKLRDVCTLVNGRAYSKPELLDAGKYRLLRVGNFFTSDHWYYSDLELEPEKYCEDGDLLYAWSASFGPRIWSGEKVIYHYHIWKVVSDWSITEKKFLYYWFTWDADQIKRDQGTGTTMTHVSMGSMNERSIFVPPPPEQQRIVAILDEAFAGITVAKANAEKNLRNAREVFENQLEAVFEHNAWRKVPMHSILSEQPRNGWSPRATEQEGKGTPVLSLSAVTGFNYDGTRVKFTAEPTRPGAHYWLKNGELLITRSNTQELVGHAAIYDGNPTGAICCDLIMTSVDTPNPASRGRFKSGQCRKGQDKFPFSRIRRMRANSRHDFASCGDRT